MLDVVEQGSMAPTKIADDIQTHTALNDGRQWPLGVGVRSTDHQTHKQYGIHRFAGVSLLGGMSEMR